MPATERNDSASGIDRRLALHGVVLFILGLLTGIVSPILSNPRMGLTSHLEGVMNGTFLIALGAAWRYVELEPSPAGAAYWLALYGTYVNWASTLLAGSFGTSQLTPIAGAGHSAAAWQ